MGMFNVVSTVTFATGIASAGIKGAIWLSGKQGGKSLIGRAGTSVAKGSKSFVEFSSKTGISKGGQKVFSHQARFPKINLNMRLDRGYRAPYKNTTSLYLGKPYNGFNTHINIQKPGTFNYHIPLNPLKWKYYNIP